MIERRPLSSLGHADHGWLQARHHFSFASYADPDRNNWGALRAWNDDTIQPGSGFSPHPHADMEIITYVREGAITHQDNLGNKGKTLAGDVQVMSAGTGIRHSEFNLEQGITRIFQLWIIPDQPGGPPSWGTKPFPKGDICGRFVTLASGLADDTEALPIRANARVLGAALSPGETLEYRFADASRRGYLVAARGSVTVNGIALQAQDGAAISGEQSIRVTAEEAAEIVLVDVAA
ncbi:hypothetical protein DBR00_18180 [Pseudomonas sp. HMWF032]|uniref:pirin family protein n=1 Tax=unclassified Pseudomonas TaxID=196821 RepID=UPI000D3D6E27|nr:MULTISPECIES: pirin family protein [unclassified Pseudomonas]PTS82048.1 hypothetical protein DBR00_18180 [Pseudomonas sp. HMWF032]PTT85750.1 hypothetical protein DBR41_02695 [Pseudomonas sp. HMWF010]WAC45792.1 pirin family protein [Pseudomonas sp. SL4(2022)]